MSRPTHVLNNPVEVSFKSGGYEHVILVGYRLSGAQSSSIRQSKSEWRLHFTVRPGGRWLIIQAPPGPSASILW